MLCLQSIFFDSCEIDSTLAECMIQFLNQANKRENENSASSEFLLDLIGTGKVNNGLEENLPVIMPNSCIQMFPSDLYLFFETTSLKNSSPAFISKVGLLLTEEDDLEWSNIAKR